MAERLRFGAAWWWVVVLVLWSFSAQATHIVGGEMDLQYVSGNSYQLTLTLYFDAINGSPGALDSDLTASIFAKSTNQRMQDAVLLLTSNSFVAYTNPACTVPSLSTRKLVYSRQIQLPPASYADAQGYYVAVERCCRNNGISNIVLPGDAGQTFYLEFPAVVRNGQPFRDSTPRIFPPLSDYACVNELFYYDFGGKDPDNDSLVYELATPLSGHSSTVVPKPAAAAALPYAPITWNPGLNEQNQLPGAPTLTIDRRTGRLQVRPTQLGLFVFGIKCSEYRRGEKIGEVRRDFQLKTLACASNTPPSIVAQLPGRSAFYRPGRDTLHLVPGADHCLRVRFTDTDPSSSLQLLLEPVNYAGPLPTLSTQQGTVRMAGMPDTITSELCFPTCLDTQGKVYYLNLIVADNGCSLPKRDTVQVAFTAKPAPNSAPTLTTTAGTPLPLHVRPGDVVSFDLLATDADGDALTLTMTGRDFTPSAVGAQLTQQASGNQLRGRFSWRATCAAAGKSTYEFEFTAADAPCNQAKTTKVVVPIQVDYQNRPPVLTSTLPVVADGVEPHVIRLVPGSVYEAELTCTDADNDPLTLTATGTNFDLAAARMSFVPTNGSGKATAKFRWEAACETIPLGQLEVTFQAQESTCQPQPQVQVVRFEIQNPDTLAFLPPNIITPNHDGKNDEFTLPTLPPDFCDARFATVKIFSRWGNEVYRSTDRTFRWDGGGGPAGVYFYLIEYTNKRRFKGMLTVAP